MACSSVLKRDLRDARRQNRAAVAGCRRTSRPTCRVLSQRAESAGRTQLNRWNEPGLSAGDDAQTCIDAADALFEGVSLLHEPLPFAGHLREHLDRALSGPRFMSLLVACFGSLALALAVVGVYGVMTYAVAQRTREIAIRMALGAQRGNVLRMVLSRAARLAGAGIAAGLVAAWVLSDALAGLLFGVSERDLVTFAIVPLVLVAVAVAAGLFPALRASHIDSSVLRS